MDVKKIVSKIIEDVRKKGDKALFFYEKKFNGISLNRKNVSYSKSDFKKAFESLKEAEKKHLKKISKNIFKYQKKILSSLKEVEFEREGVYITERFVPLKKVGIYVPGGRFSYPSSVFMGAIPAKVAGVNGIFVATPNPTKIVLAASYLSGVEKLFRISGAQAISAFAFGTESIPAVDFIAGPGNKFVTEAKREVFGKVGIDLLAGPSEVALIVDNTADEKIVLAEIQAQLEHDPSAKAFLITSSKKLFSVAERKFKEKITCFLEKRPEKQISIVEKVAPEHLFICVKNYNLYRGKIKNSGAIFVGKFSTVPLGDYVTGPSHTLPTGGTARFSSGLSVFSFLRSFAEIRYTKKGFDADKSSAKYLAEMEGMEMHKKSIEAREEK